LIKFLFFSISEKSLRQKKRAIFPIGVWPGKSAKFRFFEFSLKFIFLNIFYFASLKKAGLIPMENASPLGFG
jgi:hypothetical protein